MKTKLPPAESNLEATLLAKMKFVGIPEPLHDKKFCPFRMWRFDFQWPEYKLAVECEGGVYSRGRHVRGKGFEADSDKYNRAALDGWCVLRFTSKHIDDNTALDLIEEALRVRGYSPPIPDGERTDA